MTTQPPRRMPREEAIFLVECLMNPETPEEQSSEILTALQQGLACPHISDYVFWSSDPNPTPEKVIDRAMAYRPIAL